LVYEVFWFFGIELERFVKWRIVKLWFVEEEKKRREGGQRGFLL
jgi:hypothetical protein